MDVEYKDATEWLEGLPVGAQVLTPDDWVFAKQAGVHGCSVSAPGM